MGLFKGFEDGLFTALRYFLALFPIWVMYRLGSYRDRKPSRSTYLLISRLNPSTLSRLHTLLLVLGISLILAFVARSALGTHIEGGDEVGNPWGDPGERVEDYHPTEAQRNAAGTTVFLLLFLPGLVGWLRPQKLCPNCESDIELTYKYKHTETWTGDRVFLWHCDRCKTSVKEKREAGVRRFLMRTIDDKWAELAKMVEEGEKRASNQGSGAGKSG